MKFRLKVFLLISFLVGFYACQKDSEIPDKEPINSEEPPVTTPSNLSVIVGENEFFVAVCNIISDQIEIYDSQDATWDNNTAKWLWKPTTSKGYTSSEVNAWGNPMDVKQRRVTRFDGSKTYMGIVGGKLATIVNRYDDTKKWAKVLTDYPRAIEILPNGNAAVVSWSGNWLRVYASSQGSSNGTYAQVNLTKARGVLYDPINETLWVVADNALKAYKVSGLANPSLTEKTTASVSLPNGSEGFDLTPYYGDLNKLCVSTSSGTYFYNKSNQTFSQTAGASQRTEVTSLSNQGDGRLIETKSTNTCVAGIDCDETIDFYDADGSFAYDRTVSGGKFTRARTISEYYQTRKEYAIATYNVRYQNTYDDNHGRAWADRYPQIIEKVIRKYNFDIFGVQEARQDMIDDMLGDLGGYDAFGVSDDNVPNSTENHTHDIFYKKRKFSLLQQGKFWLAPGAPTTPPSNLETAAWGGKAKVCTWGEFRDKSTDETFYVFNAHFYFDSVTTRDSSAVLMLQQIPQIAGESPVIFTGDLNANQYTDAYHTLNDSSLLEESFNWAQDTYPATYPAKRQTFNNWSPTPSTTQQVGNQIDHIFLTSDWQNNVKSRTVAWETYDDNGTTKVPSDHNAVVIELTRL